MTLVDSFADRATATLTEACADTVVSLDLRPGSSLCGRSMIVTAAVSAVAPGSGTPTGTVTFRADHGPDTLVALRGGVATCTIRLDAGSHTVTASYTGDTHFYAAPLATLTTRIWRTGF